jgi:hypothetical protein
MDLPEALEIVKKDNSCFKSELVKQACNVIVAHLPTAHNTGSPKSLCLSCAGAYSCPAQKIVQTVILACKGYEA